MREGGQHHQAVQAHLQVPVEIVSKVGANFNFIEVSTSGFTCLIMEFTKTENILIIYKQPTLSSSLLIQPPN
jgi:hypothetical protein